MALTSAYVCQGVVVVGPGVVLNFADCDTVRRPSWWSEVRPRVLGVGVSGLGLLRRRR